MAAAQVKPGDLARAVYFDHVDHFGEPDHSIRFGDGTIREGEEHFPPLMDVMIWRADDSIDITTFSTIGMSEKSMTGVGFRTELHFAVRQRSLTDAEEHQTALFLANLATYPFSNHNSLDWWQTLRDPGQVPLFSEGMSILFHPCFVEHGWDTVVHDGQEVRLLNAVPITPVERQLKNDSGIDSLLNHWSNKAIDLFAPR